MESSEGTAGIVPDAMHAAFIRTLGGAEAIEYGLLPVPSPGPGQVLLRMEAVAVNHVDLLVRSGAYATKLDFPFILGRDVVGSVVGLGAGAVGFRLGQRVWCNSMGHAGRQGSFSEYVAAPAERVHRLPDGVDPLAAVSVLHGAATAHLGLVREARVWAGELVVILGAGGAVGSAAVQLAAGAGCRVVAVAGARDASWVAGLGAETTLDYRDPGLADRLRRCVGAGASVIWDSSGNMPVNEQARLLRIGGRIVHSAGIHGHQGIDTGAMYRRDISLHGLAISNAAVGDLAVAARHLDTMFAGGGIKTRIGAVLPLSAAAAAHRMLRQLPLHEIGGKIVLVPETR